MKPSPVVVGLFVVPGNLFLNAPDVGLSKPIVAATVDDTIDKISSVFQLIGQFDLALKRLVAITGRCPDWSVSFDK